MLPDDLFELIVDSAFVGMRKPEPGIYELTLERLGLRGEECVFIDDLEINCDAAREHGIAADPLRVDGPGDPRPRRGAGRRGRRADATSGVKPV